MRVFTWFSLFSGFGGADYGAMVASTEDARFCVIGGVDNNPVAVANYRRLVGTGLLESDIRDLSPCDLLEYTGGIYPDVVFMSPPCKGFSGCLPEFMRRQKKYIELNELTLRGVMLVMEAFKKELPYFIFLENVPRIMSTGKELLERIKSLLHFYGYVIHDGTHNCALIGGIAQKRVRYFLMARHRRKSGGNFLLYPPLRRPLTLRDVIGHLPYPDGSIPMHHLPRVSSVTWRRLQAIPPGGDIWAAPSEFQYRNRHRRRGLMRVLTYDDVGMTVTGQSFDSGQFCIHDDRCIDGRGPHNRPLTLLELSLIQSFPERFSDGTPLCFTGTDREIREGIGNAVPPMVVKAIAEEMLRVLCSVHEGWKLIPGDREIWLRRGGIDETTFFETQGIQRYTVRSQQGLFRA